jgi:type III secretory pathway component EscS
MVDVYSVARAMASRIQYLLLLVLLILSPPVLLMASLWFLLASFLNLETDLLKQALVNFTK